jgi:hypothetical protein
MRRFFLIAGRLVRGRRKFILKLQEDWAYKEEYKEAVGKLKGLVWVTYGRKRKTMQRKRWRLALLLQDSLNL